MKICFANGKITGGELLVNSVSHLLPSRLPRKECDGGQEVGGANRG